MRIGGIAWSAFKKIRQAIHYGAGTLVSIGPRRISFTAVATRFRIHLPVSPSVAPKPFTTSICEGQKKVSGTVFKRPKKQSLPPYLTLLSSFRPEFETVPNISLPLQIVATHHFHAARVHGHKIALALLSRFLSCYSCSFLKRSTTTVGISSGKSSKTLEITASFRSGSRLNLFS